jgi:hypothetical protein
MLIPLLISSVALGQSLATAQIAGRVQDESGALVPGVTVRATQTGTGLVRIATTNEYGTYILVNLPVGPYELQVSKEGFSTYAQTGIVLQVDTNPTIDVVLKVGATSEEVQVEAGAAMVETQTTGVGQVIDQQGIAELPLNGRQATALIFLAGAAAPAPGGDLNTNKNYPTVTISVAGGLANGMAYLLDGGTHNDSFNNLNLPLPFPDALQEFKVETSALPAQYGQHASAAVNAVTKSGTNQFHGDAFEFVRNYIFNARDYFGTARDSLKRNQAGGVIGGPIRKDKLFFFAGYQGTIEHSNPPTSVAFVPTQAILNGDFTAFASAACQGVNKTLATPFVNNQISPNSFSRQALNVLKYVPVSSDPCGRYQYALINNNREHQVIGRIDYQFSTKHTVFGRYFIGNYANPAVWDGKNGLQTTRVGVANQAQTLTLGDTYIINSTTTSSSRIGMVRTRNVRTPVGFFSAQDLGVNIYSLPLKYTSISVSSAFNVGGSEPGYFNTTGYQVAQDFSLIRGTHQIGFGVNWVHSIMNSFTTVSANGVFGFNGQLTGLSMSDFMLGKLTSFSQGNPGYEDDRSDYIGAYVQDSWKIRPRLTMNYGLRWEPFLPERSAHKQNTNFDMGRFNAGQHSTVYPSAPAGLLFAGDQGMPENSNMFGKKAIFAPRIGLVWQPQSETTVRASYGIFYDLPQLFFMIRFSSNPPWGPSVSLTNPAGGFADPWAGQPGGNPFPGLSFFPVAGVYVNMPLQFKPTYLQQWNLSLQKQVGQNLLLSATYIGNETVHLLTGTETNPAVYGPGATLQNTNARRVLSLINPSQGQYFATIGMVDDGGTRNYNGLLTVAQRRLSSGVTALANWTWSHCVSDPETLEITGPTYVDPTNRHRDRANCGSDRRHVINLSLVTNVPAFSKRTAKNLLGGWQFSPIFRWQTGNYSTVVTGVDNAFTGVGRQRAVQVLENIYDPNPTVDHYLNLKAFTTPAPGTLSPMRPFTVLNPGSVQFDAALSRSFAINEARKVQFRWEVFNVPNHMNAPAPGVSLANSSTFGKMTGPSATGPRIMQFALKYIF